MAEANINGLGVALVTPFNEDLTIDYEALERLIEHVIDGGCDYIVALGTTAETPTLTKEEKLILTDFIREQSAGRVPLVLGIGGNNTREVCEELTNRDLRGYCAILSVTPYYNKPSQEGLYQHYKQISEASPLPVILYNVPGRTGVNLSASTTIRLANDFSNICAIKEASGNLNQCHEIINGAPQNFKLISGDDSATCELMNMGAKGVISVLANAYPVHMRRLVSLCEACCNKESESMQELLKELISPLFEEGNPAGIKSALADLGIIQNRLRLPLVSVTPYMADKIKTAACKITGHDR